MRFNQLVESAEKKEAEYVQGKDGTHIMISYHNDSQGYRSITRIDNKTYRFHSGDNDTPSIVRYDPKGTKISEQYFVQDVSHRDGNKPATIQWFQESVLMRYWSEYVEGLTGSYLPSTKFTIYQFYLDGDLKRDDSSKPVEIHMLSDERIIKKKYISDNIVRECNYDGKGNLIEEVFYRVDNGKSQAKKIYSPGNKLRILEDYTIQTGPRLTTYSIDGSVTHEGYHFEGRSVTKEMFDELFKDVNKDNVDGIIDLHNTF